MDYEGFNKRMCKEKTRFEDIIPKKFVDKVAISFCRGDHSINFKDVIKVCNEADLTYSEYQRMESLYLAKLNRIVNV